jgi:hypothetical protein
VRRFLETQCYSGVCTTGLSIDGPGVSLRAGRFIEPAPAGQFFERYRRGPFNWESYTRRGIGAGGFATTYGGVWGGGRGSFSSFAMPQEYGGYPVANYPVVSYATEVYPSVISPAYAPIFAEQVPMQIVPSVQASQPLVVSGSVGLLGRVAVLEQRVATLERIIGP